MQFDLHTNNYLYRVTTKWWSCLINIWTLLEHGFSLINFNFCIEDKVANAKGLQHGYSKYVTMFLCNSNITLARLIAKLVTVLTCAPTSANANGLWGGFQLEQFELNLVQFLTHNIVDFFNMILHMHICFKVYQIIFFNFSHLPWCNLPMPTRHCHHSWTSCNHS